MIRISHGLFFLAGFAFVAAFLGALFFTSAFAFFGENVFPLAAFFFAVGVFPLADAFTLPFSSIPCTLTTICSSVRKSYKLLHRPAHVTSPFPQFVIGILALSFALDQPHLNQLVEVEPPGLPGTADQACIVPVGDVPIFRDEIKDLPMIRS